MAARVHSCSRNVDTETTNLSVLHLSSPARTSRSSSIHLRNPPPVLLPGTTIPVSATTILIRCVSVVVVTIVIGIPTCITLVTVVADTVVVVGFLVVRH